MNSRDLQNGSEFMATIAAAESRCAEESLGEIVRAVAARLGLGAAQSWPAEQAIAFWGANKATFSLGSNSRVRGERATRLLGWTPTHRSIADWIRNELV